MKKKSNKMKQLARELGTGRGRSGRSGAGRQGYKVTRPLLPEAVAGEGAQVSTPEYEAAAVWARHEPC